MGETSLKFSTRMEQHKKTIRDEKWDLTGISSHSQICKAGFDWENAKTLKVDERRFERKVRDCLLYTSPSPRDKRQSRMPSSA